MRITYLVASSQTVRAFLLRTRQLHHIQDAGFQVSVIAQGAERIRESNGIRLIDAPIDREISPFMDAKAIFEIVRHLRKIRPQIVNASTPKGGLLGILAAFFCRVPVRIYLIRGLRMETVRGPKRWILSACEWLTTRLATDVVAVSHSLAKRYEELGLFPTSRITVFGDGSSNGVNTQRFTSCRDGGEKRKRLRAQLNIDADDCVIGYVGRLTRDKGIDQLVDAFSEMENKTKRQTRLVLVGDFEDGDAVPPGTRIEIERNPLIAVTGFVDNVPDYLSAFDVFAFPSHREGFPNVPLEAAASELPVVGYRATGTVDAVVDGVTGTLVDIGDVDGLADAIATYCNDPELAAEHGSNGRRRVIRDFQPEQIFAAWVDEYRRLLRERGLPVPEESVVETDSIAA